MVRILAVTDVPPWPTTDGGRQRTNLLLRALGRCGQVDLLLLPRGLTGYAPDVIERLRDEFNLVGYFEPRPRRHGWVRSLVRPLIPLIRHAYAGEMGLRVDFVPDPTVSQFLARRLTKHRYDVIVGRYLQPTARSGALAYRPVILDVDDLDTDRCRTQLNMPGNPLWLRWLLRRRLEQLEVAVPDCLSQTEHLWVCSETDQSRLGAGSATILPNIPFVCAGELPVSPLPPCTNTSRILIVGSLKYVVNERGIHRFLQRVWPSIRKANPSAVFRIVGAGMSPAQQARWSRTPGVEPVGFVEDLRTEYAQAAFTVVPVFEGGGTKIKVLESLAYGRACVASRHAQRGFEHVLRHGESLWSADDDASFAEGCIALLADSTLRNALAERGRKLVGEHFTFSRFERIVGTTLERVLRENQGGVGVERLTETRG